MNTLSGVVTVETFFLCSEKESALKGKNLLSGSKFFPFRIDPLSDLGM